MRINNPRRQARKLTIGDVNYLAHRPWLTLCLSRKSQLRKTDFGTLPAGRETGASRPEADFLPGQRFGASLDAVPLPA